MKSQGEGGAYNDFSSREELGFYLHNDTPPLPDSTMMSSSITCVSASLELPPPSRLLSALVGGCGAEGGANGLRPLSSSSVSVSLIFIVAPPLCLCRLFLRLLRLTRECSAPFLFTLLPPGWPLAFMTKVWIVLRSEVAGAEDPRGGSGESQLSLSSVR